MREYVRMDGTRRSIRSSHSIPNPKRLSNCTSGEMVILRCDLNVNTCIGKGMNKKKENTDSCFGLWEDRRKGISFLSGESGGLVEKSKHQYWMFSDYMALIHQKERFFTCAEELLVNHCMNGMMDYKGHCGLSIWHDEQRRRV